MHNFPSFISIENGSLYNSYSIQGNVTLIYSINNLETELFVNKHQHLRLLLSVCHDMFMIFLQIIIYLDGLI